MSQTPSLTHWTFSYFGHISVVCGLIWTFCTVSTYNLIRKPLIMVRGVKTLSFCGPVNNVGLIDNVLTFYREPTLLYDVALNMGQSIVYLLPFDIACSNKGRVLPGVKPVNFLPTTRVSTLSKANMLDTVINHRIYNMYILLFKLFLNFKII